MPTIHLLDEDLINKIAAGEVVERPASVVKELVENALDAGATRVDVHIENSGKSLIRVRDNGSGMSQEDAKRSILRHATSKISSVHDLFAINTLGFRGEALASIAAVSQLSLLTKQAQELEGVSLVIEGGLVISEDSAPANHGTTIEVSNIFFNTPARKKFLKTDGVELRHIIDIVTQYALANPNVAFRLTHEKHELLNSPALEDQRSNIASIYGASIAKEMLEIHAEHEGITINGFIGKPHQARNDKSQQVLFVNNRWVKSSDLAAAITLGYKSMLFTGKFPIFVLSIQLDPHKIDVNVHPQKYEIKIENKHLVCDLLEQVVNNTLKKHNLIPVLDLEFEEKKFVPKQDVKYSFDSAQQTTLQVNEPAEEYEPKPTLQGTIPKEQVPPAVVSTPASRPSKLPKLTLFGQMHKTFFIAETLGGAFFIDQHAAHERVLYERFMNQFAHKEVQIQQLLQGGVIDLTTQEKIVVDENKETLMQFGWHVEPFGDKTIVLKAMPSVFGRLQPKEAFKEFISQIIENKNKIQEVKETIITRMACRAAVMAGDELTVTWMQQILDDLGRCDHPFTCPHGRPSIIKITSDELEKKFKRKGC